MGLLGWKKESKTLYLLYTLSSMMGLMISIFAFIMILIYFASPESNSKEVSQVDSLSHLNFFMQFVGKLRNLFFFDFFWVFFKKKKFCLYFFEMLNFIKVAEWCSDSCLLQLYSRPLLLLDIKLKYSTWHLQRPTI